MALKDTITEISAASISRMNRVDILLRDLKGEDREVLRAALANQNITSAVLTRALQKEYGSEAVKDLSVAHWRRKHIGEVRGL